MALVILGPGDLPEVGMGIDPDASYAHTSEKLLRMEATMPKDRVNLTVDSDALQRGRRYADRRGTSVSRLVTDFLRTLPGDDDGADLPPAVRRLLGAARGDGDRNDYRRYLEEKYGA